MASNDSAGGAEPSGSGTSPNESSKIVIPDVSRSHNARVEWLKRRLTADIGMFGLASRREGAVPNLDNPRIRGFLHQIEIYLNYLEYSPTFEISPKLREDGKIDGAFDLILNKPDFHFPDSVRAQAQRIHDSFVASNWGAATEEDDEESEEDDSQPSGPASTTTTRTGGGNDERIIVQPPPRHPIWGSNGIMHGLARSIRGGGRASMILDKRFPRIPCNRYGDNGLTPGDWFPYQMVALARGAHGSRQGGIHGDRVHGAYSIVVSSTYHHLDKDEGNVLYYSGAGSDDNTDPNVVKPGKYDATLVASISSRKPVRVLRASNKSNHFAPSVGIRYDGLYRVVRQDTPRKNPKGGLYQRFVLERLPGQPDLREIADLIPTPEQRRQFEKIPEAF